MMMISKKKLMLLFGCVMIILWMVINNMQKTDKLTDFNYSHQRRVFKASLNDFFGGKKKEEEEEIRKITSGKYIPKRRVVHLDLKGAAPKLSYLVQLLPLLSSAGATDLLIEYEDMFPYWGPLHNISATTAYSLQDISALLQAAKDNNLGVIPLVQTFGHLEFVLKLEQFKNLREEPAYPQSLCPSMSEAVDMVRTMVTQIMEIHKDSTHIHIGCDEVFQLGECSRCVNRISMENDKSAGNIYYDTRYLFLDHVKTVGLHVAKAGKIPIMWDDMLRNMPHTDIKNSGIGKIVEPMVWVYIEDIDRFIDSLTWRTYAELFSGVWTASAFKGAFGEKEYIPNLHRHTQNQISWLQVMEREENMENLPVIFRGIALTGWSRYDHFAVLCELLPVSIPSLVVNLLILSLGGLELAVSRRINTVLKCDNQKNLITPDELQQNPYQWDVTRCDYPGVRASALLSTYHMHRTEVDQLYSRVKDTSGWMTSWNMKHSFSSPWRVHQIMGKASFLPAAVRDLEIQTKRVLALYLDSCTVSEWAEQHISVLAEKLTELREMGHKLTGRTVWQRGPA